MYLQQSFSLVILMAFIVQTWIDERLFGWSRSPKSGTSAWGGSTPSHDSSRPVTPDLSDDEDHGDYDHAVNFISAYEDASRRKPRSRQGSYADLQRLRMTPNTQQTAPPSSSSPRSNEGLHMRRQRKQSLSDLVPVERIGTVDRREPFEDATTSLNSGANGQSPSA
jgi:glycerol-3-phosphate O-acyltransferase/dihydroxyacetone phosphate acyltransferase